MQNISFYEPEKVKISKSVLLEIFSLLGGYRDYICLVGGWAPYFLLEAHKPKGLDFTHIGSMDIDIAVDFKKIPGAEEVYKSIRKIIENNGYIERRDKTGRVIPHSFEREIRGNTIIIDFLSQWYGGREASHRHQIIQNDLRARKAKGVGVAFEDNDILTLSGVLPNGAKHSGEIRVAEVAGVLTMKGYAFGENISRIKDGYDIYSLVKFYKNGPSDVGRYIKRFKKNKMVIQGINNIHRLFETVESVGPIGVADFIMPERSSDDWKFYQRDAFEIVRKLLEILGVEE